MKTSPTQRSLAYLRKMGCTAAVVEKWNHVTKIRQDLFGVFDIVAVSRCPGVLFVQTTTMANRASRVQKVIAAAATRPILEAGNRIVVHGWSKKGAKGRRKLWVLDAMPVTLPMLPESANKDAGLSPDPP